MLSEIFGYLNVEDCNDARRVCRHWLQIRALWRCVDARNNLAERLSGFCIATYVHSAKVNLSVSARPLPWPNLQQLELHHAIHLRNLAPLLHTVALLDCQVDANGCENLSMLPCLVKLSFERCAIAKPLAAAFLTLSTLELRYTIGEHILWCVDRARLRRLTIEGGARISSRGWEAVSQMRTLEALEIRRQPLFATSEHMNPQDEAPVLEHLQKLTKLQVLHLGELYNTDEYTMYALCKLPFWPLLHTCTIQDLHIRSSLMFSSAESLTLLDLGACQWLSDVHSLRNLRNLKSLNLFGCDALQANQLLFLPVTLTKLNLGYVVMGAKAINALVHLGKLEELHWADESWHVHDCFKQILIDVMAQMPRLVFACFNFVQQGVRQEVQAHLPGIVIDIKSPWRRKPC
jgi:hypothetical protein